VNDQLNNAMKQTYTPKQHKSLLNTIRDSIILSHTHTKHLHRPMPTHLTRLQHIQMLTLHPPPSRKHNPILKPLETSIHLRNLLTRQTITLDIAIHTSIHPDRNFTQIVKAPHTLLRAFEPSGADAVTFGALRIPSTRPW
jgi:hypothetical protein